MTKQLKNANTNQDVFPELEDGQVSTSKLSDGAVTEDKIVNGAVTLNKLSNGAVSTIKIADDAITTDKILDGAVTDGKLSNGVYDKLNRKLYSHHINIEVIINNVGYAFYINIISTKDDAYDYYSLWDYMYVKGHEYVYALMLGGEGDMVAWDEDISVSIYSKHGDKLNPAISIDLTNADSHTIQDQIIEIY